VRTNAPLSCISPERVEKPLIANPTSVGSNNEMNDFSIPGVPNEFGFAPSEANFIRPHKRPLSSITPIIASRNTTTTTATSPSSSSHGSSTLLATVGAAGGSRIVSSTAQVLWHALEHDLSLTEALARPRLHDQLIPNYVLLEDAFDPSTAAGLAERGHSIRWTPPRVSAVQGVWRHEDGVFEAAGEPRQENSAGLTL
jgi:gamma-glutamyltranspeptidase/glutathione hydrolase